MHGFRTRDTRVTRSIRFPGGPRRDRLGPMMNSYKRLRLFVVLLLAVAALMPGCRRQARATGRELRQPEVKTVSPYGVTLDPDASPQLVTYVLLRALKDDVRAPDAAAREAALDTQFDLCAAEHIGKANVLRYEPAEHLDRWVRRWAPVASRYADSFGDDWEQASNKLVLRGPTIGPSGEADRCEVLREVEEPAGTSTSRVVLAVRLVQERGYWRVLSVGYDAPHRSLAERGGVRMVPSAPRPVNGPPPEPEPASDD